MNAPRYYALHSALLGVANIDLFAEGGPELLISDHPLTLKQKGASETDPRVIVPSYVYLGTADEVVYRAVTEVIAVVASMMANADNVTYDTEVARLRARFLPDMGQAAFAQQTP